MKRLLEYRRWWLLLLALCLLFFPRGVLATHLPDRPIGTTVLDPYSYLSPERIAQIDQQNQAWARTDQQLQVGVYVTDHLSQDLESLANDLFRHWQIGYAGTDNGVLLVVAVGERAFRIETSDHAATVLTDSKAREILDASRVFFREEDYAGGVGYIVTAIGDHFYGSRESQIQLETKKAEEESKEGADVPFFFLLAGLGLGYLIFLVLSNRRGPGGGSGPSNLLWMLLNADSGTGHSQQSDLSSSDFGGWSGGGGGGGGASSGW